jgi:7-cyano-7-deazaguanine reductase
MHKEWPFGKTTEYTSTYSPHLLCPVPRALGREMIGLSNPLPFKGTDIWTCFELSWLNPNGKPEIALADFCFPHDTPFIVESKSLKLYLCSFHQTPFDSLEAVQQTIKKDLSQVSEGEVDITIFPYPNFPKELTNFSGIFLDTLDIQTKTYHLDSNLLETEETFTEEAVYSHLLKSNCLATAQPDWGSVLIRYKGKKINHEGLLKYIISFRNHSGFAEHCVERIYRDIQEKCQPELLTVYARYTRRGGLDINPFRSNFELSPANSRQIRQ